MKKCKKINNCRNCNSSNIVQILDLGNLAYTGKFVKRGNMVDSNKFIFKIISNELKHNIHSIQILFL